MLNSQLFPPTVDFKVSTGWTDIKSYSRRQVTIDINGNRFAIINCDRYNSVWHEPIFTILRASVTREELSLLPEIIQKVELMMVHLANPDITQMEIERLL